MLEPFPDALLEGAIDVPLGPEAATADRIHLPGLREGPSGSAASPARRLILREYSIPCNEVADMSTRPSNRSTAPSNGRRQPAAPKASGRRPQSASRPRLTLGGCDRGEVVHAWESADLDALVALLTDDVFISMPPMPFEYEGRMSWPVLRQHLCSGRRFELVRRVPTVSRRWAYLRAPDGIGQGWPLRPYPHRDRISA